MLKDTPNKADRVNIKKPYSSSRSRICTMFLSQKTQHCDDAPLLPQINLYIYIYYTFTAILVNFPMGFVDFKDDFDIHLEEQMHKNTQGYLR